MTTFLIVLAIGILAGLLFNRYGQDWLSRQFVTRQSDLTSALVGVAGAFIGFHLAAIVGVYAPIILYLAAIAGALIVLWAWRGR